MLDCPVPDNAIVVPFAPQLRLLEKADAVITHAGLNTTLETLSQGLPMLCLPITNDQPGIASRVHYLGAGEVISINRATAPRIQQYLRQLLSTTTYKDAAKSLQSKFCSLDGPAIAAEIVEQSMIATKRRIDKLLTRNEANE